MGVTLELQGCLNCSRLRLKCDDARAETTFRLSAKRTNPFKSARASLQSTTGSRGVRISGSNAGYNVFRGSVKSTSYPLHSPVSPSLPFPCVTVCHHVSAGLLRTYVLTYLLTYFLTSWCRVLLEKLTGLQLVKKFPAFYVTRRFITAFTSFRHPSLS